MNTFFNQFLIFYHKRPNKTKINKVCTTIITLNNKTTTTIKITYLFTKNVYQESSTILKLLTVKQNLKLLQIFKIRKYKKLKIPSKKNKREANIKEYC